MIKINLILLRRILLFVLIYQDKPLINLFKYKSLIYYNIKLFCVSLMSHYLNNRKYIVLVNYVTSDLAYINTSILDPRLSLIQ